MGTISTGMAVEMLMKIVQGILDSAYYWNEQGEKRCKYCTGSVSGYRDDQTFEHHVACPVTLMKELERQTWD